MFILANNKPDWKEDDLCIILDTVTGKPERHGGGSAVMTLAEAKTIIEKGLWSDRRIIIKLDCMTF